MQLQIVSTVVIVYRRGKFLLVQRAMDDDIFPGKWQSAGGKVEPGERIEEAARRELAEETGIVLNDPLQFVMSYSWQKAPEDPTRLGIILLAKLSQRLKDLNITLDPELNDYGWYTLEQAERLDTIGKESPTGTLGQLNKAQEMLTLSKR